MSANLVIHKATISKVLVTPRALLFNNTVQGIYQKTCTIVLQ